MLRLLAGIGRKSASMLLIGMLVAAFSPTISSWLRPLLPVFVALLFGVSVSRMEIATTLTDMLKPARAIRLLVLIGVMMPIACIVSVSLWRALGLDQQYELILIVFTAAPPISSAASLCLLLGYDARTSLQITFVATLLTPVIGAFCFAILGVDANIPIVELGVRISAMIASGLVIGWGIQKWIGKATIDQHPDVFNGIATLVMILFLFPLLDGVLDTIVERPLTAFFVMILALVLNFGSHLLIRRISRSFTVSTTASALGLSFGNRNISFYLAALPLNPLLSLFVGVAQLPIYATPAVFGKHQSK